MPNPRGLRALGAVTRVQKRAIPLAVHFATAVDLGRMDGVYAAGRLQTRETAAGGLGVQFAVGDAIVVGTAGEQWPIPRADFERTYVPAPDSVMGVDGRFAKRPVPTLARVRAEPFTVDVSWGTLVGAAGDWLVGYGPSDYRIVGAAIFAATYDLLGPTVAPSA